MSSEKGRLEIVRCLVEHGGANVNAPRTADGMTALMWASQNGHVEVGGYLLQRGAHVNATRALCGRTPLMFASMTGHVAAVRLLRLTSHSGRTAHGHAASHPLVLAALE